MKSYLKASLLIVAGFVLGWISNQSLPRPEPGMAVVNASSDSKLQPFAKTLSIDGFSIDGDRYCIVRSNLETIMKYSSRDWPAVHYQLNPKEKSGDLTNSGIHTRKAAYQAADLSKIPQAIAQAFERKDYYFLITEGLLPGSGEHHVVTITFYEDEKTPGHGIAICQNLGMGR